MPGNPLYKNKVSKGGNNRRGKNQYNNGTWPKDEVLKAALHDYARRQLTLADQLSSLRNKYGLCIDKTTLKKLRAHYKVPNKRNRTLPFEDAQQKILDKMFEDEQGLRGPSRVQHLLALEGAIVSRRIVRYVMRTNDPGGASRRWPGRKEPLKRSPLTAVGTFQQVHCDGHGKLGAAALKMGPVSLNIYGYRDQWSGAILFLRVIPDDRHADCIGHLYLDFAEEYGVIAQQLTFDGGSETKYMKEFQSELKALFAPDIDQETYPAWVSIKSVHNTPIESLWAMWLAHDGHNLITWIKRGQQTGIFLQHKPLHIQLFKWIWPPIVQLKLNEFCEYSNTHKPRKQKEKLMPSGVSPLLLFENPQKYDGHCLAIPVTPEAIAQMRTRLPKSYTEAFAFVDEGFDRWALSVYLQLGSPHLSPQTAWDVFRDMEVIMQAHVDAA